MMILKKKIEEMKLHEKEHCDFFEKEIKKRNITPTKLLTFMGFVRCWFGFWVNFAWEKKLQCLCTASVEEVIDKHYQNQIDQLKLK